MRAWYHAATGHGRPLVLLHGIGMSHTAWNAVIPQLSTTRRVVAFDIAGFGETPSLPPGTPPTVPNLAHALAQSLREIGIERPVDVAGNSLGGCIALEAARRGFARSVVAIAPSGLWQVDEPAHVKPLFRLLRFAAIHGESVLQVAMRSPALRELLLAVPLSPGCRRMPPGDARRVVADFARAPAFETTFEHVRSPFTGGDIRVPLTIAFGDRDWIVTRSARHRGGLPAHTRWIVKRGWGHVPMWLDPAGVAQLILEATR